MTNLWGFFLQTVSLTLVAAVLLILKHLLEDKLSPRWQYGIWAVLALRALVPARVGADSVLPFSLWLEMAKAWAEQLLGGASAFTEVYRPIRLDHVFPGVTGRPVTVTDWLFVIYAIGVVVWLLWYSVSYIRLRLLLKTGTAPDYDLEAQLIRVRKRYDLPKCRAVVVDGIDSPFVCGVVSPVLAVPKDKIFDDKVMLHELLHLQHRDGLQSVFWCVLRCLHWCNPVLQWVFHRIGNDMEALCDRRVLERVEGEERRDYGVILLSMANDRYARVPGTTSVSNGGENIARRIEAIVRFKKYPKGMGLVSVCIGLILMVPCVVGTAVAYDSFDLQPGSISDLPKAMALARIERCDTVAGALDTYAKGLLNENGIYIAMTSPLSEHEELERRMNQSSADGRYACKLPAGEKLEYMGVPDGYNDFFQYGIYELAEQSDGTYTAWLAFRVKGYADENGDMAQDQNEDGQILYGIRRVTFPVEVYYSDGWCVREIGERKYTFFPYDGGTLENKLAHVPARVYEKKGDYGTLTITERTQYVVDESMEGWHPFGVEGLNGAVDPDAEFVSVQLRADYDYAVKDINDRVYAIMSCVLPSEKSESVLPHSFVGLDGSGYAGFTDVAYIRMLDENLHLSYSQNAQLIEELGAKSGVYGYHVKVGRYEENAEGAIIGTEICDEFVVTKEDLR